MKKKYFQNFNLIKAYIFLIPFFALFFSCNSDKDESKINFNAVEEFNKNISFSKDIPLNEFGNYSNLYLDVKKHLELLGFDKLDSFNKCFQIRIMMNFDKSKHVQILSLKFIDGYWSGKYYKVNEPVKNRSDLKFSIDSNEVFPKMGWPIFINKLISANILYLPTINNIPGFNMTFADGDLCIFEIASKTKYRFFYYYSPDVIKDLEFNECKKVLEIVKIIDENIDFNK